MFLQVFQLVIIGYLVHNGEGRNPEERGMTRHSLIDQENNRKVRGGRKNRLLWPNSMRYGEPQNKQHDFSLMADVVDTLKSGNSGKNTEMNKIPKSRFLSTSVNKHVRRMGLLSRTAHTGTRKNTFSPHRFKGRNTEIPEKQNAKEFWDHFLFKMNPVSENMTAPEKEQEVQKETCKTLPFSQNIMHENCDRMVIQNNLCFGKCISFLVPNQQDQHNTCSHCLPSKFTMKHLQLNCTGSSNVVKVVMMVTECKCEVHKSNDHQTANFNTDLTANLPHS
ncbi:cerberus [Rhinophrynus dorsalis]